MVAFIKYWLLVVTRAWARTWGALVERSLWAIFRDAAFLVIAGVSIFALKGVLTKLHSPVDVLGSEWETALWVIAGLISIAAVFAAYFVIEALFVTPYIIWHQQQAEIEACAVRQVENDAAAQDIKLRRRAIEAQEAHTAAIRAQISESRLENNPMIQAMRQSQRESLLGLPPAPTANLALLWQASHLHLKIQNHGVDAEFHVQIDLTNADVEPLSRGEFPAVWRDDRFIKTKRIMEGGQAYVFICQIVLKNILHRVSFEHWMGDAIASAESSYAWAPGTPERPHAHRVRMLVTSTPRPQGGPKQIEFIVQGFDVRVVSGQVQPPP